MLKDKRLTIAVTALAVLLGLTLVAVTMRKSELAQDAKPEGKLPSIKEDTLDEIEIRRPESKPTVRLTKHNGTWTVAAPVTAEADTKAVEMAVEKLTGLSVKGIAATESGSHVILEVDDKHAIRVIAKSKGKPLADLLIGASRGGDTMVRETGKTPVLAIDGPLKWTFNKEVKDWRNRKILEIKPETITEVVYQSKNGNFHLIQKDNTWSLAPGSKPIKRFSSSQVSTVVSAVANLNASDFASAETTDETAGLANKPSGTVTLKATPQEGKAPEEFVIRLGKATPEDASLFYLKGRTSLIYLVGKYIADRLTPKASDFQEPEKKEETPDPNAAPMPAGAPGGGAQIPPELLQQLQQQMGQQR